MNDTQRPVGGDDLVGRLRTLADAPMGGVDFDAVRDGVVRHRRARWAGVAGGAVSALVVATVGVQLLHRPAPPDLAGETAVACPPRAPLRDPYWVPGQPGVETGGHLVPGAVPRSAVVCDYPLGEAARGGDAPTALGRRTLLGGDLTELAADLDVRRGEPSSAGCRVLAGAGASQLLGLRYADGVVWVAAPVGSGSCLGASNGRESTDVPLGGQVRAAAVAGRWVGGASSDPCAGTSGRYGEDARVVPDEPRSAVVCDEQGIRVGGLPPPGARRVAAALNALPTRPSTHACDARGKEPTAYRRLVFSYAVGPRTVVDLHRGCRPEVLGGALEADDASSVWAALPASLR